MTFNAGAKNGKQRDICSRGSDTYTFIWICSYAGV